MNSRERVLASLQMEEPDRVPLSGSFRREVWRALKGYFGTDDDEAVRKELGLDLRSIGMGVSRSFKEKASWLDARSCWAILRSDGTYENEWGVRYKVGATGKYVHEVYHPLENVQSVEEIVNYPFPDIDASGRFDAAEETVKHFRDEHCIFALIVAHSATFFDACWHLRGYRRFLRDIYSNPQFVDTLLDKLLDFYVRQSARLIEIGADAVHLADDLGMQTGLIVPPLLWRKHFKPRMRRLIDKCKRMGDVFVAFHSDGKIEPIIPDLIEVGVNILNPIQPDCMDPVLIKERFGDKLSLWGTISIQETLPFGSVEDVKNEVTRHIKTCGHGGGLIIAPSHIIEDNVPLKNVLALYDTAKKYGRYPILSHPKKGE